jgi:hypothetical protein
MKSQKTNPEQGSNISHENDEANELNDLVKKTTLQDKVLKKMIEEIKKLTKDK